ncbi:MAG: 30S ribosomal protein S13 [Candidatus Altiarchaeales archaeon ex4484_43]|nr:MAG: 30S ribosomal protein S13 [Candidatus Altiarchaeales archaeon ex4484_43]RLI88725.1 MAG: 30S ribosomal protein S13 [Candidatus Altiarchaeales archaeon]
MQEKGKEKGETKKEEFKHLVRVSGVVLDGNLDIARALTRIKGIGPTISSSLIKAIGIKPNIKLGNLDDSEIEKIESGIKDLDKKLPEWMLNRRRDRYTGENLHLVGPDLEMANREDINLQKRLKSYRGIRHSMGLPVRGQRTRTSFRHGVTVGVKRKKVGR